MLKLVGETLVLCTGPILVGTESERTPGKVKMAAEPRGRSF
jgi:hypothetical protein